LTFDKTCGSLLSIPDRSRDASSPDGRFLPRAELEAKLRAAGATTGKPVVSYCMVGMRASVVYFVARYLGHDARLYDGSIIDWTQRKLPTKTGRN
jgi:3-mercaptopyruvate sulfurtransferase SseA